LAKIETIEGLQTWHAAVNAWQQSGCSLREAELLAGRSTALLVSLSGPIPSELLAEAEREGLAAWRAAGYTYLAGSVMALKAVLVRWPEAVDEKLAEGLSTALGAPWCWATEQPWDRHGAGRPLLMGILNLTPDSFSDGGRFNDPEGAVNRAEELVAAGADILDIGGESTRPGAAMVSVEDELERVVPVVRAIRKVVDVPISVDTYKPQVAEQALAAGADVINDITGLGDPAMMTVAARTQAPVVVMHMQGTPRIMQQKPSYREVVAEVIAWLEGVCDRAIEAGIARHQLIIDPGIGFGKTTQHNLELLHRLRDFRCLGYPVLVGTSRKSVIGDVLHLPVGERVEGTAATVALAVYEGADIIRVHDVKEMRRVIDMTQAIQESTRRWERGADVG
jgi:dihydropteroate synthase